MLVDAYLDKVPGAQPLGLTAANVGAIDLVFVSHAHFDHMADAAALAGATGAVIVCNPEVAAVLRANGVVEAQILPVTGGETVDCGAGLRMRVLPSLHSCLFAAATLDSGAECMGDLDVPAQRRLAAADGLFDMLGGLDAPEADYFVTVAPRSSTRDGGQLTYLLETADGSILFSGSSGYWRGLLAGLRPDVAVLALSGRPNVDGEPHQGSLAEFLRDQLVVLRPRAYVLSHTDPLVPSLMGPVDTGAAVRLASDEAGYAKHLELTYCCPVPVLAD